VTYNFQDLNRYCDFLVEPAFRVIIRPGVSAAVETAATVRDDTIYKEQGKRDREIIDNCLLNRSGSWVLLRLVSAIQMRRILS
jgi:hypothetical protein